MDLVGARRFAALWLIPGGLLFLIAAPQLILIGRLPDPLAVHWGSDGLPNGSMPFWVSLAFVTGFWVLVWLGLLLASRAGVPSSPALATAYFIGGLLSAVQLSIVDANLNQTDWQDAASLEWWGIALVIGAGLACGAGGWFLGTGMSAVPSIQTDPGEAPSAGLAADESPVWRGSQSLWFPVLIALGFLGTLPFLPTGLLWVPFAVAVPALLFASVGTRVDERGLRVSFGMFGWPRIVVPSAAVERAEVVEVNPMEYGGWGLRYRGGTTAVVVKKGPGIRVVRPGKRALVVTCTDPTRAAGLLNDYAARSRP